MDLAESAWRRTLSDTREAQRSVSFLWLGEGILAAAAGAWSTAVTPDTASVVEQVGRGVGGGLGGLLVAVSVIFGFNLVAAPYRQRNEGREKLSQYEADDSATQLLARTVPIDDTIVTYGDIVRELRTDLEIGLSSFDLPIRLQDTFWGDKWHSAGNEIVAELLSAGIIRREPHNAGTPDERMITSMHNLPHDNYYFTELGRSLARSIVTSA